MIEKHDRQVVPIRFPIADLHRDPRFQIRTRMEPATVDRYANALRADVELPPVRVAMVGGVPVLVDGWHRVAAHQITGASHVLAFVTEATAQEARWLAAEANLTHGLPLKKGELRSAFRAFITARRHRVPARAGQGPGRLSYRDIAKALGGHVTHQTASNWMHKDFPDIAKEYGGEATPMAEAPAPEDPEEGFARTAQEAIAQALSAARGVRDPGRRGALVAAAEAALRELREDRAWVPPSHQF
ncbi:ParB/RepB/Spo0J family partition protein [Tabrizicola sp.]|uniref:ParB/RepB/Spo0J family partition protein n=1 Tax=Tabrizicola sp. TaxID=2005166 RepID=UPI0035AFD2BC